MRLQARGARRRNAKMMVGRDRACPERGRTGGARHAHSLGASPSVPGLAARMERTKSHYPSELESCLNSLDNLCLDSSSNLARFVVTIGVQSYDLAGCPCGHRLRRRQWRFRKRSGRNCPNELLIFQTWPQQGSKYLFGS